MKQQINILIEKDESGYIAYCSEIEGYKVTAKSLDIVVNNLKTTIANYLETSIISSETDSNKPIWEMAQDLVKDLTEEEKSELPKDGAEQHDHYIYGTPKINS
jgi:predicted RNase H-like HicB family nuclease